MGKKSVFLCNNGKPQRTILHTLGCTLPETSINQGQEVLTNFYKIFAEFFDELDRFHACPEVATPEQREELTNRPHGAVVIYTEVIDSKKKDSVMPPLI